MSHLAEQLRRLHDLAVAGRPANYATMLAAAAELERLERTVAALRDEIIDRDAAAAR